MRQPVTKCRSCGAEIVWARTAAGKPQPLDAFPNPKGNRLLVVPDDPREDLVAVVAIASATGERYMPHHATCPQADTWRKR